MTAPLLTLAAVGATYPHDDGAVDALADVSFDLAEGERVAVIGESGSGKSTLALAIAGLLPPTAVSVGRIGWRQPMVGGRDIGFVFQDPGASLDPVMNIGDQVAEVRVRHCGEGWRAARRAAIDLLDRVRLPQPSRLARAYPHELSGGQRQRAALAMAIAAGPRLLIADEATSALDTVVQAEIVALIGELVRAASMALVFVTHDIALASRISDRIVVLYAGRMVEAGAAAQVVGAPRHPYTQALVAGHLDLSRAPAFPLPAIAGAPPDPFDPPRGCRFAPRCSHAFSACLDEPAWSGGIGDGARCVGFPLGGEP